MTAQRPTEESCLLYFCEKKKGKAETATGNKTEKTT